MVVQQFSSLLLQKLVILTGDVGFGNALRAGGGGGLLEGCLVWMVCPKPRSLVKKMNFLQEKKKIAVRPIFSGKEKNFVTCPLLDKKRENLMKIGHVTDILAFPEKNWSCSIIFPLLQKIGHSDQGCLHGPVRELVGGWREVGYGWPALAASPKPRSLVRTTNYLQEKKKGHTTNFSQEKQKFLSRGQFSSSDDR